MTMPKIARVADMLRSILPSRVLTIAPHEEALGVHLRGNAPLYEAIIGMLEARIDHRASLPVPDDPIACKASMERDHELRILLNRIEYIYKSPVTLTHDDGEQPA